MSRFRVKTLADSAAFDSELFVARNLGTQLQNSSYGHFHQYLKQCGFKEELLNSFRLPRIIVVGGRSAGKSSLLESITKCPIFPRHRDFCTKAPIELRMKNSPTVSEPQVSISYHGRSTRHLKAAHQILAEVHDIMQGIDGIDDKPIKIKICQVWGCCWDCCIIS